MKKKKVIIDFTVLKYPNCGLGQVAINFGHEICKIDDSDIEWIFLSNKDNLLDRFNRSKFKSRSFNIFTKNRIGSVDANTDLYHIISQLPKMGLKKVEVIF